MAIAILILERSSEIDIKITAKYVEKSNYENLENFIDINILKQISMKHGSNQMDSKIREVISYRLDSIKIVSIYLGLINEKKNQTEYFLMFIIDKSEFSEQYSIMIDEIRDLLKIKINSPEKQIQDLLKNILESREGLYNLIREKNKIEKKIISKANILLDKGEFQKAQELIKFAKTLPEKITYFVKKGDESYIEADYKAAARNYREASFLAKKLQEIEMEQLLIKMAQRMDEVPNYKKSWEDYIDNIIKPLKKIVKRERGIYTEPLEPLIFAINISDILEDDKMIEILKQFESLLKRANELSEELNQVDDKILEIIKILKKE